MKIAQERGGPPDNLALSNRILADGVPQREQDVDALEELNKLSKHLAFAEYSCKEEER